MYVFVFFLGSLERRRIPNLYILLFSLVAIKTLVDFAASFLVICVSIYRKQLLVLKSNTMQYLMFVRFVSTNPVVSTNW